jgi:hypothetical protein
MKAKLFGMMAFVMFALAGTGIAYGHWQDQTYANVNIQTGYLQITLTNNEGCPWVFGDQCVYPHPGTSLYGGAVVSASQSLGTTTITNDTMNICIANAYPSICVFGAFDINNTGTVPAQVAPTPVCWTTSYGPYIYDWGNGTATVYNSNWCPIATIYYGFCPYSGHTLSSYNFGSYSACCNFYGQHQATTAKFCPGQEICFWYGICFNYEALPQNCNFNVYATLNFQNYEGIGGCPTS